MAYTYISSSKFPTSTTGLSAQTTLAARPTADATLIVLTVQSAGTTARLGGPPTFGGTAMSKVSYTPSPLSASGDESNVEMWYVVNPGSPRTSNIVVPRTAGTFWTTTTWASCSLGSQSLYLTSSWAVGNSAVVSCSITTAPASGGIWYNYVAGDGANNPASTYRQWKIQNTDVGTWNWDVQVQSQSAASSILFGSAYASETWAIILGAWGEELYVAPIPSAEQSAMIWMIED